MKEVNLLVLIEVQPGKRNIHIEAFEQLKPLVLAEPGCIQYELFSDAEDENKFILVEKWASDEGRRAELFRGSAACHTCHVDPDEYRARVISLGPSM